MLYCLKCTYWSSWKITLGKCYRCIHLLMMTVFRPWWTALSRDEEECLPSYTSAKGIVKYNYTAVNNEFIFLMMINSFSQFSDCEISYVFSCFVFGKYSVQSQTISLKISQFWIKMCQTRVWHLFNKIRIPYLIKQLLMTCNYLLLVFVVWYPFYGHFMDTFLKYVWAFQIFTWVLFTCIFFFLGSFHLSQ